MNAAIWLMGMSYMQGSRLDFHSNKMLGIPKRRKRKGPGKRRRKGRRR